MKLCSYRINGKNQYGVMTNTGIIDLSGRIGEDYPTLVALIRDQAIEVARDAVAAESSDLAFDSVKFLPLTVEPVNIFSLA